MSRNKRIINPFKTPKTRRFFNNKRRIRLLTYGKTKDNDNFTWLYYGTKQKKSGSVVETRCRYVLGAFKEFPPHGKVLICFGLNPSVGVPEDLEPTVQNLNDIAFSKEYDGWVMLNLFPLRDSSSDSISDTLMSMHKNKFERLCTKNLEYIDEILSFFYKEKENVDILLAWGGNVKYKNDETKTTKCFKRCIKDVYNKIVQVYGKNWMDSHIKSCYRKGLKNKRTAKIHPRHLFPQRPADRPSPQNAIFENFNFEDYIKKPFFSCTCNTFKKIRG